jgi:hypothetical protein
MKPTKLQKEVCDSIITIVKSWRDTNNIDSVTHMANVEKLLYTDELTEDDKTDLVSWVRMLYVNVNYLRVYK